MKNIFKRPSPPPVWDLTDLQADLAKHEQNIPALREAFSQKVAEVAEGFKWVGEQLAEQNAQPSAQAIGQLIHSEALLHSEKDRLHSFKELFVAANYGSQDAQGFGKAAAKQLTGLDDANKQAWGNIALSESQISGLTAELPWLEQYAFGLRASATESPASARQGAAQTAEGHKPPTPQELYAELNSDNSRPLEDRAELATRMFNSRIAEVAASTQARGSTPIADFAQGNGISRSFMDGVVREIPNLERDLKTNAVDYGKMPAYSWTEAVDVITTAFDKLHPEMGDIARMAVADGWVHAKQDDNKFHNAFSHGNEKAVTHPSGHPYLMVNFDGSAKGVLTLAHELGHAAVQYLEGDQQQLSSGEIIRPTGKVAVTLDSHGHHHTNAEAQPDQFRPSLMSEALHETFAHFTQQLVRDELVSRAKTPDARRNLMAYAAKDIKVSLTQHGLNTFEQTLHKAGAEGKTLSTQDIAAMARDANAVQPEIPDAQAVNSVGNVTHFVNMTPHYLMAYALAEIGAQNLNATMKSLSPDARKDFGQKWVDMMRDGGKHNYGSAMREMGVNMDSPDMALKAVRKPFEAQAAEEQAMAVLRGKTRLTAPGGTQSANATGRLRIRLNPAHGNTPQQR